ncbi:MAG TPA: endonuclease/exonuclease/phosphatase family protein [Gemmataceae bacterium]
MSATSRNRLLLLLLPYLRDLLVKSSRTQGVPFNQPRPRLLFFIVFLLLLLLVLVLFFAWTNRVNPPPVAYGGGPGEYLFCFWNTENFFDNRVNGWNNKVDRPFDRWFAEDNGVFEQKVKNLTEVLASLNDGKGPDILALAEVEAESQAAEQLMDALNKAIKPEAPPYQHILKKNPHSGREIVTAILTRLPVVVGRTQLIGSRLRILEGHITMDGQDLTVLATHWTSRLSDESGIRRAKYGDQIYGRFRALYKVDPDVSLLVCGDFNDNPDDPSVTKHLRATGDLNQIRAGDDPPLYNVFADLWAKNKGGKEVGTHFYHGKGSIFDHIVVSPGMVNGKGGWQCLVDTAQIVKHRFVVPRGPNRGHPLRFGDKEEEVSLEERGVSDHLPVTVRLKVTR